MAITKKITSAIVAIALVVTTVATFAFKGNVEGEKVANSATKTTLFYWYNVDASGNIVTGSEAFLGTQRNVSYATSNLPCTPGADADCIRGFSSPITIFPTSAVGDTDPLQKELP